MPPSLILIRHAQALHNVANNADSQVQAYGIHDPELSELGRQQCQSLRASLQQLPNQADIGLIVVSPMRRTCETAMLALDWLIDRGIPIQANANWQETTAKPCDTGTPVSAVAKEFPKIDFSQVDPVYPDKTTAAGGQYAYKRTALLRRAQIGLEELYDRPEKIIVVVSHSGFMRSAVAGCWWFNADYRGFDMTKSDEVDGTRIRLDQWPSTVEGGLKWSWSSETSVVELGHGFPEDDDIDEKDNVVAEKQGASIEAEGAKDGSPTT